MADIYDFSIEAGNIFEVTFNYTDEDGVPINLNNYCVFLRWVSDTGIEENFSSTTSTTDYQIVTGSDGSIKVVIPAKTTQNYNYATATYDLEIQTPNETYTGSGFEVIRLLTGTINFIQKNVSVDINNLRCDPYLFPRTQKFSRIADINDVQYNGNGITTTSLSEASDTITVDDNFTINYIEVLINNFSYRYPQDLRILLTPPTGDTILLSGHEKITNNVQNFNIVFSPKANSSKFLYNGQSNEPINIVDKTSIINYNNLTLTGDLNSVNGTSSLGNWVLTIADDGSLDEGSIGSWGLIINHD